MRHLFAGLLLAATASLLPAAARAAPPPLAKVSAQAATQARENGNVRVLVMLRAPEGAPAAPAVRMDRIAARANTVLAQLSPSGHAVHRRFATIPALALDVDANALRQLAADPAVLRVDVDAPGRGHAVAPDAASVINQVSVLQDLGLDGQGQKVAVVDSGVAANHPDLLAQVVGEQCFCSGLSGSQGCCPNGQDTQSGLSAALDDNGHGTNVSGIIVGAGNIAPRGAVPAAQLVAVKVLDANGSFCCSSDVVAALDWLIVNHPDLAAVNLSLGTNALFPGDCDNASSFTQAMAVAVDTLTTMGVVVTASTGNQGSASMSSAPACVANAVGVGATWDFQGGQISFLGCSEASTSPGQPTCFSNHSTTTDLYAAGAFVTSTGNGGGTSTYGGTSQAAPMVAACAVALRQASPGSTVADRVGAMRVAPTTVVHGVTAYPFLDCADAVALFSGPARVRSDFDGDGMSDLLWRHASRGANVVWRSGASASQQAVGAVGDTDWQVVGVGDFDGDGQADLFWRHAVRGSNAIWPGADHHDARAVTAVRNPDWRIAGVGDFDGDGSDDLLWRNIASGANVIWRSANYAAQTIVGRVADQAWTVAGVGDFDADGRDDVLWRHQVHGSNSLWRSGDASTAQQVARVSDIGWEIVGVDDLDGDGQADVFWRHGGTGANALWLAADASRRARVSGVSNPDWRVVATGDFDGDGMADLMWRNMVLGNNVIWGGADSAAPQSVATVRDVAWKVVGAGMR